MFGYRNLREKFSSMICFDDGAGGSGGAGGNQGGQGETGQIDFSKLVNEPGFSEYMQNSDFFKKAIQSAEDKVRTKLVGEKRTVEETLETMRNEIAILTVEREKNQRVEVAEEIGLPQKYRDRIRGNTKEEMVADGLILKKALEEAVAEGITEKLKQGGGLPAQGSGGGTFTKEQFGKMSYSEKVSLYNTNKNLYEELSK